MSFDFPASPTTGQVYSPAGGISYKWDGEKWKGGVLAGLQLLKREILVSSATYTRAATSEALMSDTLNFTPVSPTSKIYMRAWTYCRLLGNTTLAVDDQAGTLVIKTIDASSVYNARQQVVLGDANRVQVAANVIIWENLHFPTMNISTPRGPTGLVSIRMYGNANYANLTLESYSLICEVEEWAG